jgi:hypothetical protein
MQEAVSAVYRAIPESNEHFSNNQAKLRFLPKKTRKFTPKQAAGFLSEGRVKTLCSRNQRTGLEADITNRRANAAASHNLRT